jgi:hypothetical protein
MYDKYNKEIWTLQQALHNPNLNPLPTLSSAKGQGQPGMLDGNSPGLRQQSNLMTAGEGHSSQQVIYHLSNSTFM